MARKLVWAYAEKFGYFAREGINGMPTIAGSSTPYTDYFDPLVALVTHLSATHRKSRTVPNLVRDLGFPQEDVEVVLTGFRGLFRRSREPGTDGNFFCTVHLRYARWSVKPGQKEEDEESHGPLESTEISALVQLISSMVSHEQETSRLLIAQKDGVERLSVEIKQRDRSALLTTIVSSVAAVAAIIAAVHGHH
jgi:hypothetical protein